MTQKPTLGRIVLFTAPADLDLVSDARTVPAVITRVLGMAAGETAARVNLTVFFDGEAPGGASAIPEGLPGEPGRWCWPERG